MSCGDVRDTRHWASPIIPNWHIDWLTQHRLAHLFLPRPICSFTTTVTLSALCPCISEPTSLQRMRNGWETERENTLMFWEYIKCRCCMESFSSSSHFPSWIPSNCFLFRLLVSRMFFVLGGDRLRQTLILKSHWMYYTLWFQSINTLKLN